MEENQYVIISKTDIQKRIEGLKKVKAETESETTWYCVHGEITGLENMLSQSTPLIP